MSGSIGSRFVLPLQQILDPTGVPYNGAQAWFYATGTSTPQNTYADVNCTVPNPNPVLTNSAGFWPQIFMIPAPPYRIVVQDPDGAVLFDCDPCGGVPTGAGITSPGLVPVGAIMPYGGAAPPTGWVWCDGSEVSRTVFPALFASIGTRFGLGDGATTFNVPDLRGNVAAGNDAMGGIAAGRLTSGNSGVDGATTGAMGGSELVQTHNHDLNDPGHGHVDGGHTHPVGTDTTDPQGFPITGGGLQGGGSYFYHFEHVIIKQGFAAIQNNTTGITESDFGSGNSQNVQPTLVVGYIIFAG